MSRKILERPAVVVARTKQPGLHFVGGVPSLALQVTARGSRSWILRVTIAGNRRDMGLGSFPDVSLAIARHAARHAREKIGMGRDPIEGSRAARGALAESRASAVSFERVATLYVEAHESAWRGAKHAVQWRTVMEAQAYPAIGALNVEVVKLPHVMPCSKPSGAPRPNPPRGFAPASSLCCIGLPRGGVSVMPSNLASSMSRAMRWPTACTHCARPA